MNDISQKNKKFRLPRKIKKKLKNDLFSYPKSEKDTYLIVINLLNVNIFSNP